MKTLSWILLLLLCGLVYVRLQQPKMWDAAVISLLAVAPDSIKPTLALFKEPTSAVGAPNPAGTTAAVPTATVTPPTTSVSTPPPAATVPAAPTAAPTDATAATAAAPAPADSSAPPVPANPYMPPNPLPAKDHWTWTIKEKVYQDVVITKAEADAVHIIYDGGVGSINMADLPPDLQKSLNYDPAAAAAAAQAKAEARAKIDALQAQEMAKLQQAQAKDNAAGEQTKENDEKPVVDREKQREVEAYQQRIDNCLADLNRLQHPAVQGGPPDNYAIDKKMEEIYQLQQALHSLNGHWYGPPVKSYGYNGYY